MKPLLLLFLLPCLAYGGLQEDIDSCILLKAHYLKAVGYYKLEKALEIADPSNPENVQITIDGPLYLEGYFEGPLIRLKNPKDCVFREVRGRNHIGGFWEVLAFDTTDERGLHPGSASRNSWYDCRAESKGTGWLFKADGGADISCTKLESCNVEGCSEGLKVIGPNALNVLCLDFTGSNLGIGADLTQGGCDSKFIQGGFSYAATGWKVNPGYQISVDGATMEANGIVVDFGSGTGSGSDLKFSDVRNCGTLLRSGQNGASTRLTVSALKVTPGTQVKLTGDSGQAFIELQKAATTCKVTAPKFGTVKKTGSAGFVSASGG